uniref:Methylosome subunit pICln n=1 Tax=Kalanchoe fedtschenkoi TaxID=63787 RepID=A0A7N0UFA6_KALFE
MVFGLGPLGMPGTTAGQPILDADNGEEFMHVQSSVTFMLENRSPETTGTLCITIKQVVWFNEVDGGRGFGVDFLHNQIETGADEDDSEDSDWSNEPHDLSSITEMRHVPSDPNRLDNLFEIFCECAEWMILMAEIPDSSISYSNGNHDLANSILQLQINDHCFEDVEEMDENKERSQN